MAVENDSTRPVRIPHRVPAALLAADDRRRHALAYFGCFHRLHHFGCCEHRLAKPGARKDEEYDQLD